MKKVKELQISGRHRLGVLGLITLLLNGILIGALIFPAPTNAANKVVTIFADGKEKTVSTDASTVQEVLNRAGVNIDQNDLVEPGLDKEISSTIFNINVYRAQPYLVVDGNRRQEVMSAYDSPKLIVENSTDIQVYPEDDYKVEPIRDFVLDNAFGNKITIIRSTPATISVDGKTLTIRTQAKDVKSLLEGAGVKLGKEDIVAPAIDSSVSEGMNVSVTRVGRKIVSEEQAIARPVKIEYDDSQALGWQEVKTEGKDGKRLVTYEIVLHDGKEVDRKEIQNVVQENAVAKIIEKGNKRPLYLSAAPDEILSSISHWADVYGANYEQLARVAECESHFNPGAANPSGASGLFQFMPSTFRANATRVGINNPDIWNYDHQAHTAAYMFSIGQAGQWVCR